MTDEQKILSLDFHFAVCLLALDDLVESLAELYSAIWQISEGDDETAHQIYSHNYQALLSSLAENAESLEITDEFRQYFEDYSNDNED